MEQCRNERAGVAGDPRENPVCGSPGVIRSGIKPGSPWCQATSCRRSPGACTEKSPPGTSRDNWTRTHDEQNASQVLHHITMYDRGVAEIEDERDGRKMHHSPIAPGSYDLSKEICTILALRKVGNAAVRTAAHMGIRVACGTVVCRSNIRGDSSPLVSPDEKKKKTRQALVGKAPVIYDRVGHDGHSTPGDGSRKLLVAAQESTYHDQWRLFHRRKKQEFTQLPYCARLVLLSSIYFHKRERLAMNRTRKRVTLPRSFGRRSTARQDKAWPNILGNVPRWISLSSYLKCFEMFQVYQIATTRYVDTHLLRHMHVQAVANLNACEVKGGGGGHSKAEIVYFETFIYRDTRLRANNDFTENVSVHRTLNIEILRAEEGEVRMEQRRNRHRPARFPHTKIRGRPRLKSNPVRPGGRRWPNHYTTAEFCDWRNEEIGAPQYISSAEAKDDELPLGDVPGFVSPGNKSWPRESRVELTPIPSAIFNPRASRRIPGALPARSSCIYVCRGGRSHYNTLRRVLSRPFNFHFPFLLHFPESLYHVACAHAFRITAVHAPSEHFRNQP
ncbi:hypothetical protein PR048_004327 [Dryococelus australis]|uniref:Uncharacterized protein n=1 Tax=Dryococelus australis TaxID=614101 RepID=A0ABQ9I696_9NEOP|nr:hypothetical protein PR048_004327 [Dryococelus australis]